MRIFFKFILLIKRLWDLHGIFRICMNANAFVYFHISFLNRISGNIEKNSWSQSCPTTQVLFRKQSLIGRKLIMKAYRNEICFQVWKLMLKQLVKFVLTPSIIYRYLMSRVYPSKILIFFFIKIPNHPVKQMRTPNLDKCALKCFILMSTINFIRTERKINSQNLIRNLYELKNASRRNHPTSHKVAPPVVDFPKGPQSTCLERQIFKGGTGRKIFEKFLNNRWKF